MQDSPYDLILILTLVWGWLAASHVRTKARVRRLERIAGIRPPKRPKKLPEESHIRTVPVRVERRRAG